MIRVIAIGKKHESWVASGIDRYEKRLRKPYDVAWELLPHSHQESMLAREEESERILSAIKPDEFVILLDETGVLVSNPSLSNLYEEQLARSRVCVVIGGAYGVTAALKARAQFVWSLSGLVFPHQLVRLMLVEQLYRSQEIARGGKYHHE